LNLTIAHSFRKEGYERPDHFSTLGGGMLDDAEKSILKQANSFFML